MKIEQARKQVCDRILRIMRTYHTQEENGCVDSPGGLEHMGDVWSQFLDWEAMLLSADREERETQ